VAFEVTISVRWDDLDGSIQRAEAIFGEGAVMVGIGEHPTAVLVGASVGLKSDR
jgi:hypothetical protein